MALVQNELHLVRANRPLLHFSLGNEIILFLAREKIPKVGNLFRLDWMA
jgi:hypothetical protein